MFGSRNFLFALTSAVPSNLYGWGSQNGGLGNGSASSTSPSQVGIGVGGKFGNWTDVSTNGGGSGTGAVLDDGSLWTWGVNTNGVLGLGDTTTRSSPVQVGALKNWKQIAMGYQYCLAVKTDGTLWAWGDQTNGNLGNGVGSGSISSPVQIGGLSSWKQVGAGSNSSYAVKTDGTLWSWGTDNNGSLGQGTVPSNVRLSPVQVGGDVNWDSVSTSGTAGCAAARKTTGDIYIWGSGSNGRLGNSTTTSLSSPIQIGAGSNWLGVATSYHTLLVKNDGTLWSTGWNAAGQLGLGDTTSRSAIVQVGGATNWENPFNGPTFSFCIKTDDTLWSWGKNDVGQLGLGNSTDRSSPVQVGSDTWLKITASNYKKTFGLEL